MPPDPVELLRELVAIPSVNPMGRDASDPTFGEARLTAHLERLLRGLGLRTRRQTVAPGRENLLARLDGETPPEHGGPLLLWDAHQDTVPADGMTIEPFAPAIRDGRLHGRGACDVKGGMAAMLAAVARLAEERPPGMPTIVIVCPVDEEYHLVGADRVASLWSRPGDPLLPRAPDAAVVAEPTGLGVVVAHKGVIRWRCQTHGRAAHSSQPEQGDNAVYAMARLVTAAEAHAREVFSRRPPHPWCGPPTLNVGTIRGGSSINVVPERCQIEIEIRVPPGGDPQQARDELIADLRRRVPLDPPAEHEPPYMAAPAMSAEGNARLAERLGESVREVTGDCRLSGVRYATDAAFYARAGTPAVVCGPGAIEQAHTADEWIDLEQLRQAAEVYYRFARSDP